MIPMSRCELGKKDALSLPVQGVGNSLDIAKGRRNSVPIPLGHMKNHEINNFCREK